MLAATFFIIGGFIAGREATLQRAKAAGHELGVHGLNHFNALLMREPETLSHELSACADELERAVGERPQLVRPPFGGDAGRTARAAAKHGLGPVVLWTVLCFDWAEDAQADAIAKRAVAEAHPGGDRLPARRRRKGSRPSPATPRSQRCRRSCRASAGTATSSSPFRTCSGDRALPHRLSHRGRRPPARRAGSDGARRALRDTARRLLRSERCGSGRSCSGAPCPMPSSSTGRRRSRTSP